jgi:uridine monophosphate synthetase
MAKIELIRRLYEIGVIKFGEFTLKSGKKSPYYIDLRILPSYPDVLCQVGKVMGEMIMSLPEKPTRLCGIPTAGLAIATAIGMQTGIPVVYTRKEPVVYKDLATQLRNFTKEGKYHPTEIPGVEKVIKTIEELSGLKTHGIARYVDGDMQNRDKIGIVDDLITTAESKLEGRDLVKLEAKRRNISVDVIGVYVLLDREQGGREALEKEGIQLFSIFTITEVIKCLYECGLLESKKYNILMDYINSERIYKVKFYG